MKNKYVPRQTKRVANSRQFGRKPYDKKMRRLSVQSKYKKPVSHEQTSDSEVPQKMKRRRLQSHTGTTSYRTFRRKAKTPLSSASNTSTRVADKSDSSSDYDDEDETDIRNGNVPSSTSTIAPAPPLLNIPSTSTGITANGYSFRMTNTTYDSDDDDQTSIPEPSHQSDSLLRVIRSPPVNHQINNHQRHHLQFQVNEGASTSTQFRNNFSSTRNHPHHHHHHHNNNNHENGRRKYRKQEEEHEIEDYASTNNSNSLLSSSSAESSSIEEESYPDYYSKKRKINNSCKINNEASTSRNGFLATPPTPLTKKTPEVDSGIAPSPSSNSRGSNNLNGQKSLENMKKIDAVKKNIYRKNMQSSDDSD